MNKTDGQGMLQTKQEVNDQIKVTFLHPADPSEFFFFFKSKKVRCTMDIYQKYTLYGKSSKTNRKNL